MILIHVYTPLHILQLEYLLKNEVGSERYVIFVPERFSSRVQGYCSELGRVISYSEEFDASSFTATFFLSRARSIVAEICPNKVSALIVPDVAYSFSNYLVSYFLTRNTQIVVTFYLDGSGSMISNPISRLNYTKDLAKRLISVFFSREKYIRRARELGGADLDLCTKQLSVIKNDRLIYRDKVSLAPGLIAFPERFEASNNIVVFVVQDAKVIMPGYIDLYKSTIVYLTNEYPEYQVMILLRNRDHEHYFDDRAIVSRRFVGESAEAVISRLAPKVVVSHYSTVLLNLAIVEYPGDVVSFDMPAYNRLVGDSLAMTNEVQLMHNVLGVKSVS